MSLEGLSKKIVEESGGFENIENFTNCVTRLRITIKDQSKVNQEELKSLEGVLGVNQVDRQIQLIFGPGKVNKVAEAFERVTSGQINQTPSVFDDCNEQSLDALAKKQKNKVKASRNQKLQGFMSKFSNIFVPLIPGFIAAGLLAGISALIASLIPTIEPGSALANILAFMSIFQVALLTFLPVMVGYNASKAYGGSGVVGGIIGALFLLSYGSGDATSLLGQQFTIIETTNVASGLTTLFNGQFQINPAGGIIGVLIAAICSAYFEKWFAKFSPDAVAIFWPSLVTMILFGFLTITIIMPLGGVLYSGMNYLFIHLYSNPLGAAILAGLFLLAVLFGIHQGFIPVYQGLVDSIGYNALFPILAMAGAGQVGAALALYVKSPKGSNLRKLIAGAIIPGFLGIGEPLIYAVTLPRVKPFITAMIGGSAGGFFIGLMASLGFPFGLNTVFGPSGFLAIPLMTGGDGGISILFAMFLYVCGLLIAYVTGFIVTYFFGSNVDLS